MLARVARKLVRVAAARAPPTVALEAAPPERARVEPVVAVPAQVVAELAAARQGPVALAARPLATAA